MEKAKLYQYLRVLPLIVIAPIIYLIWDNFGASALQQSVKPSVTVEAIRVGMPAPDIKVAAENVWSKQAFQLSSLKGRPVVLHFWATWCGPCLQELPELLQSVEQLRNKNFVFVAVAEDDSWNTLNSFFLQHPELAPMKDKMILILDPDGKFAEKFGSNRFPETFLINVAMVMDNKFTGAQSWNAPQMGIYYDSLLKPGGKP